MKLCCLDWVRTSFEIELCIDFHISALSTSLEQNRWNKNNRKKIENWFYSFLLTQKTAKLNSDGYLTYSLMICNDYLVSREFFCSRGDIMDLMQRSYHKLSFMNIECCAKKCKLIAPLTSCWPYERRTIDFSDFFLNWNSKHKMHFSLFGFKTFSKLFGINFLAASRFPVLKIALSSKISVA